MATFKAIVKGKRKDGFYPVYIRVVHRRKLAYIPDRQVRPGQRTLAHRRD